jgi:hypothetical protein
VIEAVVLGSANSKAIRRPRIVNILRRRPVLRARIEAGTRSENGQTIFDVDTKKVASVAPLSDDCRRFGYYFARPRFA